MQFLSDLYPWLTGAIGGLLGAAFLLPTKLGEALFKYRFDRAVEAFKAEQGRELEILKEQLNHLGDRGKRSNEMEFTAISAMWDKFVEAYLATRRCVVRFIEIPSFGAMTADEFEAFLSAVELTDTQKLRLRNATDREKAYSEILAWRLIVRAQKENFELSLLLMKQGFFIPKALKDEFKQGLEMLTAAQSEQYVKHQFKDSGIGYEKRSELLKNGDATLERLGGLANARLFRQQ
jgi:hypothetical protein